MLARNSPSLLYLSAEFESRYEDEIQPEMNVVSLPRFTFTSVDLFNLVKVLVHVRTRVSCFDSNARRRKMCM